MYDMEKIANISEKSLDKADSIFNWLYGPKEEARTYLTEIIKENNNLTSQEKISLIYHSRKLAREYANCDIIYEQAKKTVQFRFRGR